MRLLLLFLLLLSFQGCMVHSQPIKGISFVSSGAPTTQAHIKALESIHANHAAVMPFGFIRSSEDPEIAFNTERQWYGERKEGVKQYIEMLHESNIQVMLKPQLWLRRGAFTGYLAMESEKDWQILEASYRDFIMTFVEVANETNTELFCIGTELEQFIIQRPQFWEDLISEIRTKYKGQLTYAANWDEYKRVAFWDRLDFIGVDAYFPISDEKTPSVEQAQVGWRPWKDELKGISETFDKPILFTEYGYRSVDFAGKEPWRSDREMTQVNLEAQRNLTQALFNELYKEPWFAGGFIWKWFMDHENSGGIDNAQFSPQNKPAEVTIRNHFRSM